MTTAQQYNALGAAVRLISQHRWFVVLTTLLTTAVVVGLTLFVQQFEYRADAQVMVVQYADNATVDGERMLRSTEHISRNLTKVVGSTSFMDATLASGKVANGTIVGETELDRKQEWNRKVRANSVPNSAIIQVSAYDADPARAAALSQAVTETLIAKASEYHGANEFAIDVKQIDKVLVSDAPVRPNIPFAVIGGVLLGVCGSLVYLFMVKEWRVFSWFMHYWKRAEHGRKASQQPVYVPKEQEVVQPAKHAFAPTVVAAPMITQQEQKPDTVVKTPEVQQQPETAPRPTIQEPQISQAELQQYAAEETQVPTAGQPAFEATYEPVVAPPVPVADVVKKAEQMQEANDQSEETPAQGSAATDQPSMRITAEDHNEVQSIPVRLSQEEDGEEEQSATPASVRNEEKLDVEDSGTSPQYQVLSVDRFGSQLTTKPVIMPQTDGNVVMWRASDHSQQSQNTDTDGRGKN